MNPFDPPRGASPTNHGARTGFPFPPGESASPGMQYPSYYGSMSAGSMPRVRAATTVAPAPVAPPARPRPRMLLAALGGAFVGAAVLAAVIGLQIPDRVWATQATSASGQVRFGAAVPRSALDLQAGNCYNTGRLPPAPGASTPITTVEAVPCAAPHTGQVVAKVGYSPTDTLADVRATRAATDCEGELRRKVAAATLTDPAYASGTLVPADDTTWAAGRTIACVVMSDAPRTGSALT